MAKTLIAFMEQSQVPDRQALQEAIKNLRFRLSLDEAYVPFEWSGYLPCTLDGEDAGVDIRFADSASRLAEQPQLQQQIGNRGTAILLRGGGDPREQASALILGAVLAPSFGALVQQHGDDTLCAAEQLLEEARDAFSQAQEG
jgi:hypothetical protein